MEQPTIKKLGLAGLTAIVFGSMIGSGIFNIPQNMACGASVGAVIIAWLITAVGILFLVATFKSLSDRRPDLNAGIYQYAQEGYGNYLGFNIAWGYWLCTAFGNVAYAIMLNDSLGVFFPELLRHGWQSAAFGTALIWTMFAIVIRGLRSASILNNIISLMKIMALALIICIILFFVNFDLLSTDFWGNATLGTDVGEQIKHTMLVTLWCFIGIEGAVSMSARAKRPSDVGKASVIGFLLTWVLYVMISVLSFGIMTQPEMSQLENPSVAYLLKSVCGEWAYYFVIISIICSLTGGWISWTLICAQVPYEAAKVKIMPRQFMHLNRHGMPTYGLFISSIIMQIFYMGIILANSVYMAAIQVAGMMVLPAYLFSGLFLVKASRHGHQMLDLSAHRSTRKYLTIGIFCTIFCLWLIYAGGIELLMSTSLFYIPGTYFYIKARRQNAPADNTFGKREKIGFTLLCVLAVTSIILLTKGYISVY